MLAPVVFVPGVSAGLASARLKISIVRATCFGSASQVNSLFSHLMIRFKYLPLDAAPGPIRGMAFTSIAENKSLSSSFKHSAVPSAKKSSPWMTSAMSKLGS